MMSPCLYNKYMNVVVSRVAESEVFGWSRSRNPKSTRSRSQSRNFSSDSDS